MYLSVRSFKLPKYGSFIVRPQSPLFFWISWLAGFGLKDKGSFAFIEIWMTFDMMTLMKQGRSFSGRVVAFLLQVNSTYNIVFSRNFLDFCCEKQSLSRSENGWRSTLTQKIKKMFWWVYKYFPNFMFFQNFLGRCTPLFIFWSAQKIQIPLFKMTIFSKFLN